MFLSCILFRTCTLFRTSIRSLFCYLMFYFITCSLLCFISLFYFVRYYDYYVCYCFIPLLLHILLCFVFLSCLFLLYVHCLFLLLYFTRISKPSQPPDLNGLQGPEHNNLQCQAALHRLTSSPSHARLSLGSPHQASPLPGLLSQAQTAL